MKLGKHDLHDSLYNYELFWKENCVCSDIYLYMWKCVRSNNACNRDNTRHTIVCSERPSKYGTAVCNFHKYDLSIRGHDL